MSPLPPTVREVADLATGQRLQIDIRDLVMPAMPQLDGRVIFSVRRAGGKIEMITLSECDAGLLTEALRFYHGG
jgi:hypothetical protein